MYIRSLAGPRKRRSLGTLLSGFEIGLIITLLALLFVAWREASRVSSFFPLEITFFILNGAMSIYGQIVALRRQAAFHYVSFSFDFLFMAVTPLIQLGDGDDPIFWEGTIVLKASLIILSFTVAGLLATLSLPKAAPQTSHIKTRTSNFSMLALLGITLGVGVFALILLRSVIFSSREGFEEFQEIGFGDAQTGTLCCALLLGIPFYGAAVGLRRAVNERNLVWIALFLGALCVAFTLNNPTILSRSAFGGTIFFIVDYFFQGRKTKWIALILIAGVIVAPTFNMFRSDESFFQGEEQGANIFSSTFLSYDYDAFQTLCYTIFATTRDGISWGSNILGSALFFVPRAWWPGKPEPTPHITYITISQFRIIGTDSLSTPLFAEGFFAFSWAGAILISVGYWILATKLTVEAWKRPNSFAAIAKSVLTALVLVILRGSLITAAAFVAGALASAFIPWRVLGERIKGRRYAAGSVGAENVAIRHL